MQEGGPLVASVYSDSLGWGLKPAAPQALHCPLKLLYTVHTEEALDSFPAGPCRTWSLRIQATGSGWLASHPPEVVRGELGFTTPKPQASCWVGLPCLFRVREN